MNIFFLIQLKVEIERFAWKFILTRWILIERKSWKKYPRWMREESCVQKKRRKTGYGWMWTIFEWHTWHSANLWTHIITKLKAMIPWPLLAAITRMITERFFFHPERYFKYSKQERGAGIRKWIWMLAV